jgi:Uncharacterized protein conserved in bacteria
MHSVREYLYRFIPWTPLLFLGALVALTYWLNSQVQVMGEAGGGKAHAPDLFIKEFHAVIFDENGFPKQQLVADYAEHFMDDETIMLTAPHLTIQNPGRPRLTVTAQQAQVSGDRDHVYLEKDVVLVREANVDDERKGLADETFTMKTEFLHLLPNENKMETKEYVELSSPSGRTESIGMELDDNSKEVKLHSSIKGSFEPIRKQ